MKQPYRFGFGGQHSLQIASYGINLTNALALSLLPVAKVDFAHPARSQPTDNSITTQSGVDYYLDSRQFNTPSILTSANRMNLIGFADGFGLALGRGSSFRR